LTPISIAGTIQILRPDRPGNLFYSKFTTFGNEADAELNRLTEKENSF